MINNTKNSDCPEHANKMPDESKHDNKLSFKKEKIWEAQNSYLEEDILNKKNLKNVIKNTEQLLIYNDTSNKDLINLNKINNCQNTENCIVDDKVLKVFGVDSFNLKNDYNFVNNFQSKNNIHNQSYLNTVGDSFINKDYNISYFNIDNWEYSQIYIKLNLLKIILRKNSYCFKNFDFLEKPIELFLEQTILNNFKNKILSDKIYKNILEEFWQLNKQ